MENKWIGKKYEKDTKKNIWKKIWKKDMKKKCIDKTGGCVWGGGGTHFM